MLDCIADRNVDLDFGKLNVLIEHHIQVESVEFLLFVASLVSVPAQFRHLHFGDRSEVRELGKGVGGLVCGLHVIYYVILRSKLNLMIV